MKKALFSGSFAVFGALAMAIPGQALAYGGGGVAVPAFAVPFFGTGHPNAATVATTSTAGQVLGASTYNFTVNLKYGAKNQDVTELQKILIAEGDLKLTTPTGWFGPLTLAAVKKYQIAHAIEATGFVGTLTRAALSQGSAPTPVKTSMVQKVVNTIASALAWSAST